MSALAVMVLAYFVSKSISRPVAQLAEAASRVTEGDLSVKVNSSAGGELQVLVASFNRMADNLRLAHESRKAAMDLLLATTDSLKTEARAGQALDNTGLAVAQGDERDLLRISDLIRELIAERERHLLQLRTAADIADAANRAKSDFLANMSHEIRTPMNGILGMTDLALGTQSEAERLEYLRVVKTSAESLLGIINDILDFSKIEAGKLVVEHIHFDLHQTFNDVISTLGVRAHEKQLALTCTIAPETPAQLVGDPMRIRQVLLNLVGNAIKFTEQGGVTLSTQVIARSPHLVRLLVEVQDSGIGIPADKLQHIFEAFSQADTSTTRKYGGTGLGLSITSRLVELMGGTMAVDSTPGQGSNFHFELGLDIGEALALPQPDPAAETPPLQDVTSLSVLLVEDNLINQQLAMRWLKNWGHTVCLAINGEDALNRVTEGERFDVVLMDMQMPVMGGIEATQRIRSHEAQSQVKPHYIVAMTANAMQSDRDACLAAGMDDYISKPINKIELLDKLRLGSARN
jgi:signal transduction histidine kinase/ActR/RegA family two-component response regulator